MPACRGASPAHPGPGTAPPPKSPHPQLQTEHGESPPPFPRHRHAPLLAPVRQTARHALCAPVPPSTPAACACRNAVAPSAKPPPRAAANFTSSPCLSPRHSGRDTGACRCHRPRNGHQPPHGHVDGRLPPHRDTMCYTHFLTRGVSKRRATSLPPAPSRRQLALFEPVGACFRTQWRSWACGRPQLGAPSMLGTQCRLALPDPGDRSSGEAQRRGDWPTGRHGRVPEWLLCKTAADEGCGPTPQILLPRRACVHREPWLLYDPRPFAQTALPPRIKCDVYGTQQHALPRHVHGLRGRHHALRAIGPRLSRLLRRSATRGPEGPPS